MTNYSMSNRRDEAQRLLEEYLTSQKKLYIELQSSLQRYLSRLKTAIAKRLKDFPQTSVTARLKEWDKLVPKLAEGRTIFEVGDLIGLRVVTMYEDEVTNVANALYRPFFASRPVRRRWSSSTGRKAGYAGIHVQVRLPSLLGIRKELHTISAELQIRTLLQHVWAELSHNDFYKAPMGVPRDVQDRLFRLAASLDVLSDEIVFIRNQLADLSDSIKEQVLDPFNNKWREEPVDEFTLTVFGNRRVADKLNHLRTIAVEAGFRESAWHDQVRVGAETDLFVAFARMHDLETVGQFEALIKDAFNHQTVLTAIGHRMQTRYGEKHNLFARPLFILALVLWARNPTRPCTSFDENIVEVVQEVIFETTSVT